MNALQQAELFEIEEIEQTNEEQREQLKQRFKIETVEQLNWALRKLAVLEAKQEEITALASAERERINQWEKRELEAIQRSREFFEALISEYAGAMRQKDPKWRVTTPYGQVGFRRQPPKWEWKNEEELVSFLETSGHAELVRVKKEADKNGVKKAFEVTSDGRVIDPVTGEVVPGVSVVQQPEKVVIKVTR